ncbi:MAG: hypothetical protein QW448_04490 [Thermofilaceae archaeon]
MGLEDLFSRIEVVCQTAATFVAFIREGAQEEILRRLSSKAKVSLKLGEALVKFDYGGHSLTYVAPDRLLIRLRDSGTLEDAKELLLKLLG